jgi:hypothetical protein
MHAWSVLLSSQAALHMAATSSSRRSAILALSRREREAPPDSEERRRWCFVDALFLFLALVLALAAFFAPFQSLEDFGFAFFFPARASNQESGMAFSSTKSFISTLGHLQGRRRRGDRKERRLAGLRHNGTCKCCAGQRSGN